MSRSGTTAELMNASSTIAFIIALAIVAAALGGCDGRGGDSRQSLGGTSGQATLGATSAPSEEVTVFDVGLRQVTLHRSGGGSVTMLPEQVRVDFARFQDVTQVLAVTNLTAGTYISMDVAIDYTGAAVLLTTATASAPAVLENPDGTPLTGVVVQRVSLGTSFRIDGPGDSRLIEMVFDLDASLDVDAPGNVVVVTPVINAAVRGAGSKPIVASGIVESLVSTATADFVFDIRPEVPSTSHGVITARADSSTTFVVDGIVILDPSTAQAALAAHTAERALLLGTYESGELRARFLLVGTTFPELTEDRLRGTIVERTETPAAVESFTLSGATVSFAAGGSATPGQASAVIDTTTVQVFGNGSSAAALTVGARVALFGRWTSQTSTLSSVTVAIIEE